MSLLDTQAGMASPSRIMLWAGLTVAVKPPRPLTFPQTHVSFDLRSFFHAFFFPFSRLQTKRSLWFWCSWYWHLQVLFWIALVGRPVPKTVDLPAKIFLTSRKQHSKNTQPFLFLGKSWLSLTALSAFFSPLLLRVSSEQMLVWLHAKSLHYILVHLELHLLF